MAERLKLYVKPWCPWCVMARDWLDRCSYHYEWIDVLTDGDAYAEMRELSGQSLTPTLVAGDLVLPDFGTDKLEVFLKRHKIETP